MAITNTDEFLAYSSFNSTGGVTTSDTFNTWRKKTNGIINAIDSITIENITPSQLSLGAPTWTVTGALQTYNNGAGTFKASAITSTSLNSGSGSITTTGLISGGGITGTSLNIGGPIASSGNISGINITASGPITSQELKVGDNFNFDLRPGSSTYGTLIIDGPGFYASGGGYAQAKALFVGPTPIGLTNGNPGDGGQGKYYFYVGQTGECSAQSLKVDNQINAKGILNLPDMPGSKTPGNVNNKGLALNFDARPFEGSNDTNIVDTTIYNGRGAEIAKFVGLTKDTNFAGAITAASFNGSLNGNALSATTAQTISNSSVTAAKLNGGQSGSAPIYGARAWADFGTTGGLRGTGGNIASVINTASGRYSVTFTTDMPNVNYAAIITPGGNVANEGVYLTSTTSKTRSGFDFVVARATDGSSSGDLVNMASPGNLVVFG